MSAELKINETLPVLACNFEQLKAWATRRHRRRTSLAEPEQPEPVTLTGSVINYREVESGEAKELIFSIGGEDADGDYSETEYTIPLDKVLSKELNEDDVDKITVTHAYALELGLVQTAEEPAAPDTQSGSLPSLEYNKEETVNIYIASKLENHLQVEAVRDALVSAGHSITYDWTRHGSVQSQGIELLKEIAENERRGVVSADALVVLLPGGRGTHTELGMACALNIPVMLVADHPNTYFRPDANTCAFYWNKNVHHYVCYPEDQPSFVAKSVASVCDRQ